MNLKDIHDYMDTISLVISYIVNIVLIYLVFTQTPKELKPCSRILFQCCAGDLFYTSVILVTKEVGRDFRV